MRKCVYTAATKDIGQISVSWVWPPQKQAADNKKKSSRKTIMQPQGRRGRCIWSICRRLKETTQEIPVGTKKPGGGGARGHILSAGTEVLQSRVCWKSGRADCRKTGTSTTWLSFKPHPHFSWFPWGNKATALLACSPDNLFEIRWPNLTV